jgi:hypothetical protein
MHRAGVMVPKTPVPVSTLSFHASAVANGNVALTVPATVQFGDILVLKDRSNVGTSVPTGFTALASATGFVISFKRADGSEPSTTLVGLSVGSTSRRELLVFRGDVPANTVTGHDPSAVFTTGDPADQVVNASGGAVPLIVVGGYYGSSGVDPRGFSPAADGEVSADSLQSYFKYKIYNSSPADVTISQDDEGISNNLGSGYIQVS